MTNITPHKPTRNGPTGEAYAFDAEIENEGDDFPAIGDWYWVKADSEPSEYSRKHYQYFERPDGTWEWLACVMAVGSNFVELRSPNWDNGSTSDRIHFDNISAEMRRVEDPEGLINERIAHFRKEVQLLLGEVQEVTKRLGVVPHTEIADQSGGGQNALAVLHQQVDTASYKNALIVAKDEDLPALFKKVELANKLLASWMCAPTMPTRALMGPMKKGIKDIEERIYTIELYAGLTEEAVKVADGDPARPHEPLRVMQRRLYMDEECLLDYDAGGMSIRDVGDFDKWIARPHNRDRLLPFDRTLVAFRVRRTDKEREDGGNMMQMFINSQIRDADKKTFLYVRNGEQIWRVDCDFVFDEMIIPNKEDFDPSGPMMVKSHVGSIEDMIPKALYDAYCETYAKHEVWVEENRKDPKYKNRISIDYDSPYYKDMPHSFRPGAWQPFDDTNVWFDEAKDSIDKEIKRYNRVAVIIQGLFDRSLVLHPHPPVQVWNPESFANAIELVYDAVTLTHGDKPDFEAYRARLNALIDENSIVTGQEEVWMMREAERENERQRNNWRDRHRTSNYVRLRPYGNKGPGFVSHMTEWKGRAKKAVFRWTIETYNHREHYYSEKKKSIEVPASKLLNVSAYTPGDYKQFFTDPRTRQEYLKWAPLLLAAEDFHAGKIPLGAPGDRTNDWEH